MSDFSVPKPDIGRPTDSRATVGYLATRPELAGLAPFDPTHDVDLIDEINRVTGNLLALVSYADPNLGPALQTALANALAATASLLTIAGAVPFSNFASFPAASTLSGKGAIALDTGAVYRSDGTTWGTPLGYVTPRSLVDALVIQVAAVQAGQTAGRIGYQTQALLFADLNRAANTLAEVTYDSTPANNGVYIKIGASGTGSWLQSSFSRVAQVEARVLALEQTTGQNLAADSQNRQALASGTTAARHIVPGSLTTVATDANQPYSWPALKITSGGTNGYIFTLAELGLNVGDVITSALDVYLAAGATGSPAVTILFRDGGGAVVGTTYNGPALTAPVGGTYSGTQTVPANAATLTVRLGGTTLVNSLLRAVGVWRGTLVKAFSQDAMPRSEVEARVKVAEASATAGITANTTALAAAVVTNSTGEITPGVLPASAFIKGSAVQIAKSSTGTYFRSAQYGEGRQFTPATDLVFDTLTFPMDTAATQAFKDAAPTLYIFIWDTVAGSYLYQRTLNYSEYSASLSSGTLSVPIPKLLTALAGRALRIGMATPTLGLGFVGGALGSGETGGYASAYTTNQASWTSWAYASHGLAFSLAQATATPKVAIENQQVLVSNNKTDVSPSIPNAPTDSNPSSQAAWGAVLQPGAGSFNFVTLQPYAAVTAPVRVEVRQGTGATVLAYATVPVATWNASLGVPLQVFLNTPVTTASADQITVLHYGAPTDNTGYWRTPLSAVVVARAYISPGANQTLAPSTSTTAPALWVKLYYDAAAAYKTYATPVPGQSTDPATLRQAAWDTIYGPADIYLPRKVYVLKAAGEEFTLYNDAVVRAEWPRLAQLDWESSATTNATQIEEGVRISPNALSIGTFTLTLNLYGWGRTLALAKTTTVQVLDKSVTTAVRYASIGDSITHRTDYQARVLASIANVNLQGIRQLVRSGAAYNGTINYEGRGGWSLSTYLTGGSLTGRESPFMFPTDLSGTVYRGNTLFWRRARGVAEGTVTDVTDGAGTVYDFDRFALAAKEGGASYAYDATTGYPLTPTTGWIVFDPTKAAGSQWQTYNGSAWVADATQSRTFAFDYGKYLTRYAWAFAAGNPTHISILSTANDFIGNTSVSDTQLSAYLAQVQTVVDSINTALPAANVAVILPTMPSSQDGGGAIYGVGVTREDQRRSFQTVTRALIDKFDTDIWLAKKVQPVIGGGGVDPVYGYSPLATAAPSVTIPQGGSTFTPNAPALTLTVNPNDGSVAANRYVPNLVRRTVDGIHPSPAGLYQAGDWVAGWVQATR